MSEAFTAHVRSGTPRMTGRRALVTGGASGIGRASVHGLAAEGARVAVLDVRAGAADPVAEEARAVGGLAIALTCDVRDEASVGAATRAAADAIGGLDTVVVCAGITATGATHSVALADWQLVISVNLTGVFLVVKHSLPTCWTPAAGRSSRSARQRRSPPPCAPPATTLPRAASCSSPAPSPSSTSTKGSGPTACARALSAPAAERSTRPWGDGVAGPSARLRVPMSRAADPSEIAAVVAFLCSDEASFLTGAAIPVTVGTPRSERGGADLDQ